LIYHYATGSVECFTTINMRHELHDEVCGKGNVDGGQTAGH
jgi:hypothetical protein